MIASRPAPKYIRLASMTVAELKNGVIEYLYADHLGTLVVGLDDQRTLLWRDSRTPFGEKINPVAAREDRVGYTGHIEDDALKLTYMQARYYDPVFGRFLSNDPVGFAEGGTDYFNRYAYTANNPVNAIDPLGRDIRKHDDRPTAARAAAEATGRSESDQKELKTDTIGSLSKSANFEEYARRSGGLAVTGGVKKTGWLSREGKFKKTSSSGTPCCGNSSTQRFPPPNSDFGNPSGGSVIIGTVLVNDDIPNGIVDTAGAWEDLVEQTTKGAQELANTIGAPVVLEVVDRSYNKDVPNQAFFSVTPEE